MSSEIKILLTSDLHLGIPDSPIPHEVRVATFGRIAGLAADFDLLLIGGDLIDNPRIDDATVGLIKSEFNRIKSGGTEIIYSPGLGEMTDDGRISPMISDFKANHLFSAQNASPYTFVKETQKIQIYGAPAYAGHAIPGIKKESDEGFHIGLFYVDFNSGEQVPKKNIFRLHKEDIKSLSLDFYAFGHNHNFKMFKVQDRIIAAYPGTPEATSLDETGDRYIISIALVDNEIQYIKRLAVNAVSIESESIECSEHATLESIKDLIGQKKSDKVIYNVSLTGRRRFNLDMDSFGPLKSGFFALNIDDCSSPGMDLLYEAYGSEESVRGEFMRIIKDKYNRNEIPKDISWDDLAVCINYIIQNRTDSLEDWLCSF